jgi:hypothetical protein
LTRAVPRCSRFVTIRTKAHTDIGWRQVLLVPVLLSVAAVVAGVVWVYTMGSLFGVLLIIGGVMALGVTTLPIVIGRIATSLFTGSLRGRWWE